MKMNKFIPTFLSLAGIYCGLVIFTDCSKDFQTTPPKTNQMEVFNPDNFGVWQRQNGPFNPMNCIWGTDINNVYAAGMKGAILHYNGDNEWHSYDILPGVEWESIWGSDAANIYAVGNGDRDKIGVIYKISTIPIQQVAGYKDANFYDITGITSQDIYAVGTQIAHFDGKQWSLVENDITSEMVAAQSELHCVWAADKNNVWVAGDNGKIFNFDGTTWSSVDSPTQNQIRDMRGAAANNIFAITYPGEILHYNGQQWSIMQTINNKWNFPANLAYCIFGLNNSHIFIGAWGQILKFNGVNWEEMNITSPKLNGQDDQRYEGLWAASEQQLLCVGKRYHAGSALYSAVYLHSNGQNWSNLISPCGFNIEDIWGTTAVQNKLK